MPSKDIRCEFCEHSFRKNDLAPHVKAKHKPELAKFILQEYIDEPQANCLKRYAAGINPKCNPIYSRLYTSPACYFFGANPKFFDENDEYGGYIKSDENMKIHNAFLSELITLITLSDFLKAERDIQVKSNDYVNLYNIKKEQDTQIKLMTEEINQLRSKNLYQQEVINDYKEATDCNMNITEMKNEIESLTTAIERYKETSEKHFNNAKNMEDRVEYAKAEVSELYQNRMNNIELELMSCTLNNTKLREEVENLTTKREAYANTKIEKEVKKIKEKMEKKHEKEIDELEDKIDELKKTIKKNARDAKKKKDDSDSDSD